MSCKPMQMGPFVLAVSESGQQQTVNHIVDACLLTKSEGGLQSFHQGEDQALNWRETAATTAPCWLWGCENRAHSHFLAGLPEV